MKAKSLEEYLNSNIEIHKSGTLRSTGKATPYLNSNIEIHKCNE